jgi:hypothetical protein
MHRQFLQPQLISSASSDSPLYTVSNRKAQYHAALPSTCHQCSVPVPYGWGYCIPCSEAYSSWQQTQVAPNDPPSGMYATSERSLSGHSVNNGSAPHNDIVAPTGPIEGLHQGKYCGCCSKAVDISRTMTNGTCSKRCEWVSCGCCPQCGRHCASCSVSGQPYCCVGCASQSHQANWCPTCGVRQMLVGSTHCSAKCAANAAQNFPIRQRKKIAQQDHYLRHEVMAEQERHNLLQPLRGAIAGSGSVVVNVIKCTPHTMRRKGYLTYRSHIEQGLTAGAVKYGFGGEGNEQRRYMPLPMRCTLGSAGSAFAPSGTVAECCEDPICAACVVLRHGINRERLNVASHYCTSDLQFSLLHALQMPSPGPLRAVAVCRAVIGTPSFVRDPSQIVPGVDGTHCTIITTGSPVKHASEANQEGTYLFRDDAIELLHILLVQ